MKKGHQKLLIISLILTSIMVINCFLQIFNFYAFVLFLFGSFLIIKKLLGFESNEFPNKREIMILILNFILILYTLTYVTVFKWGILKSRFDLDFFTFLEVVFPLFLIIILTEILRFLIIRKGRRYVSIWIIGIVLFTLTEVSLKMNGYDFSVSMQVVKFYLEVVLVTLTKNIFLCYLTNISGYKPAITYRFLIDMPLYILPFFPNLGVFMDSIIKAVFPLLLIVVIAFNYKYLNNKNEEVVKKHKSRIRKFSTAIIILFMAGIVALSSTKFIYFTVVVGSGSMSPSIEKGDIAFAKKVNDLSTIKKDDTLIFNRGNIIVIHRVINIVENNGQLQFYTKGDANTEADYDYVKEEDVVGVAVFKIKYMGYPTVWLNEKLK